MPEFFLASLLSLHFGNSTRWRVWLDSKTWEGGAGEDESVAESEIKAHRQADRQTGRQADRYTHTHTRTQTHRHTDTQTHRHTDTQTSTHRQVHTDTDMQTQTRRGRPVP